MCVPYDLFNGTIKFEQVALNVTFDLLLKNFGHNFFIVRDWVFIFGMCVSYDKAFPTVPNILNMHICDLNRDLWRTFEKL